MNSTDSHTHSVSRKPLAPASEFVEVELPFWAVILFEWLEAKGKETCVDCPTR